CIRRQYGRVLIVERIMSRATCIYCLEERPIQEFTADHVLPRLLGTFENNLTLTDAVCGCCNSTLGTEVEGILASGSAEALLRFYYATTRSQKGASRIPSGSLKIKWPLANGWGDAWIELREGRKRAVPSLMSQAGLRSDSAKPFEFFTERHLARRGNVL